MPNRRVFIALIVLCLLVLSWWVFPRSSRHTLSTSTTVLQQQRPAPKDPATSSQATPALSSAEPAPSFEVQRQRFLAAYRTPIAFYGKVIDQHSEPVPQAEVHLSGNDKALGSGQISEYSLKTDANGLFEIERIVGVTLFVTTSKQGYLKIPQANSVKVTSSGLFEYGLESTSGPHRPDKDAPVIFTLHKIGEVETLVKIGEKNFRIARDGSPLSIAVDEQGAHQVTLRCWNNDLRRPEGQQQYDWKLEIIVSKGGLRTRNDAFDFEAPQEGYASSDTVDMPASLPYAKWDSFAERSYFVRFDDGTFARANLRMRAGGDHFVVWESFYNPKAGSPNLESPASSQSAAR